jgi:hypothetical protein
MSGHRYIYCATDGAAIKVGASNDPRRRVDSLAVVRRRRVSLLCFWDLHPFERRGLWVERSVHHRLRGHIRARRAGGEWYPGMDKHFARRTVALVISECLGELREMRLSA